MTADIKELLAHLIGHATTSYIPVTLMSAHPISSRIRTTTKRVVRMQANGKARRHTEGCDCGFCARHRPVERLVTMIDVIPEPPRDAVAAPSPELSRNIVNETNVLPSMDDSYVTLQPAPTQGRDPYTAQDLQLAKSLAPIRNVFNVVKRLAFKHLVDIRLTPELLEEAFDLYADRIVTTFSYNVIAKNYNWMHWDTTKYEGFLARLVASALFKLEYNAPLTVDLLVREADEHGYHFKNPHVEELYRRAVYVTKYIFYPGSKFEHDLEAFKLFYHVTQHQLVPQHDELL